MSAGPTTEPPSGLSDWERAYLAFEGPERARAKLHRRMRRFGAGGWPRDWRVVELFCGPGLGLRVLGELGFRRIEGVDRSLGLLRRAAAVAGPARLVAADCRSLPFPDASRDLLVVHGGLHHLEDLEALERVLDEAVRVLRPGGRLCAVEPWDTPFLRLVHWLSRQGWMRRLSPTFDAFQWMYEEEASTYDRWLAAPEAVRARLHARFAPERERVALGKLWFMGAPRRGAPGPEWAEPPEGPAARG